MKGDSDATGDSRSAGPAGIRWSPSARRAVAGAVGLVAVLAVLLPYGGNPPGGAAGGDPGAATSAAARGRAIPPRRLQGPVRLPAPPVTDAQTRAVLAAARWVGPIRHGGGARHLVALTFDDGPGPFTGRILAILRRTDTPATFFQVGRNLDADPYPARATMLLGRVAIGDHTYTHASLEPMSADEQQAEIISTAATMQAHGESAPRLFRPPYGAFNQDTEALLAQRGMAMILWSVDSEDYERPGVKQIVSGVVSAARPGAIVLMHDGGGDRSQTVKALPKIIKRLRHRGYGLVTVPELLERDPPAAVAQVPVPPSGSADGAG